MSIKKNLFRIFSGLFLMLYIGMVWATSLDIENSTAVWLWSNNSLNTFSTWWITKKTSYTNEWNNSDIIWDYLSWFYYNSLYWFFELNWSSDNSKNIRITSSTDLCNSGYGYKLGGYAKSDTLWLIDFDYNSTVYVYYCLDDASLHGKAYSDLIGYQNFEWLHFQILSTLSWSLDSSADTLFVNNTTTIFSNSKESLINKSNPNIVKKEAIEYWEESIFYIWKTKK